MHQGKYIIHKARQTTNLYKATCQASKMLHNCDFYKTSHAKTRFAAVVAIVVAVVAFNVECFEGILYKRTKARGGLGEGQRLPSETMLYVVPHNVAHSFALGLDVVCFAPSAFHRTIDSGYQQANCVVFVLVLVAGRSIIARNTGGHLHPLQHGFCLSCSSCICHVHPFSRIGPSVCSSACHPSRRSIETRDHDRDRPPGNCPEKVQLLNAHSQVSAARS